MEKITIGMIGAGFIGKEHARALRLMKPFFGNKVKLVGVADTNEKEGERLAREFDFEYYTADIEKVINDDNINTIFICIPTKFHLDILEKAGRLGKAVFCEKPLAMDYLTAKKMEEIVDKYKIKCQVGFVLRFTPIYHALKQILKQQNETSELMTVILRDDQVIPIKGSSHFTPWRADVSLAGAGVLIEHGIHDVDMFEWFFGPIKNIRAEKRNFAGNKGIEDFMQCDLTFANGVKGSMVHIWHDIEAHQAVRHLEIFYRNAFIKLEGYGTEGMTVRDNTAYKHFNHEDIIKICKQINFYPELAHRIDMVPFSDYYALQDYSFLKSLLENTPLLPGIKDGVRAHKVVAAAYKSADLGGTTIDIDSFNE